MRLASPVEGGPRRRLGDRELAVSPPNVQTPPNRSPGAFRSADRLAVPWMCPWPIELGPSRPAGLSRRVLRGHVAVPVVVTGFLIGRPQVGPEASRLRGRGAVLDHDAHRDIRGDKLARAHDGDPDQSRLVGTPKEKAPPVPSGVPS